MIPQLIFWLSPCSFFELLDCFVRYTHIFFRNICVVSCSVLVFCKRTFSFIFSTIKLEKSEQTVVSHVSIDLNNFFFFMDGVQLPHGQSHFEETVYFLPLSSQKFLVLILSISKGWKAESILEPPSGFEHRTIGLAIQYLNH